MFCYILLGFTLTIVVSSVVRNNHILNAETARTGPDVNPTVGGAYAKLDIYQIVEIEIQEMKRTFQAKGQAMDKEMAKTQAILEYQQTKLDNQQKKMKMMEKEIDRLKETVSGQSQMINNLKRSKIEVENELKSDIYLHQQELGTLKHNVELLLKCIETSINVMDKHSLNERFPEKPGSETVDKTGAVNDTLVDKQNVITVKTNRDTKRREKSLIQPHMINNFEDRLSILKSVSKPRMTKRQVSGEIAFSAYLSHDIQHLAIGHTIKCDQIIINDGNSYNQYTGVFTAPSTGVYLLTFHFDVWSKNRYEGIKLVVNNRNIVDAVAAGLDGNNMGGNTAIIRLIKGETVWLESYDSNDGEVISPPSYKLTTFSGVLLYQ